MAMLNNQRVPMKHGYFAIANCEKNYSKHQDFLSAQDTPLENYTHVFVYAGKHWGRRGLIFFLKNGPIINSFSYYKYG